MKKIVYNKLIRDKIPEIIEQDGKTCVLETLPDEQYIRMLHEKLVEEAQEFLQNPSVEELADMGEVMHAILAFNNISLEEFQRVRLEKLAERGGFGKRLLLKEVIEEE